MLVFAFLFAGLACLGTLVGSGFIGHPIGHHAITGYGWSLMMNSVALSAFFIFLRRDRAKRSQLSSRSIAGDRGGRRWSRPG